jgi:hypothetical protein
VHRWKDTAGRKLLLDSAQKFVPLYGTNHTLLQTQTTPGFPGLNSRGTGLGLSLPWGMPQWQSLVPGVGAGRNATPSWWEVEENEVEYLSRHRKQEI